MRRPDLDAIARQCKGPGGDPQEQDFAFEDILVDYARELEMRLAPKVWGCGCETVDGKRYRGCAEHPL